MRVDGRGRARAQPGDDRLVEALVGAAARAARRGFRRRRRACRAGARRSRRRRGAGPGSSCGSCGSSPSQAKPARVPLTRKRGPRSGATALIHRCERTPPGCSSARKTSSSTCAPGRRASISAYTRSGRPKSSGGLVHEVGAEVEQQAAALVGGRQLAPAVARPPAEALEARLEAVHRAELAVVHEPRTVRKSPSKRRFWKTVSGTPARSAASISCSALGRPRPRAACPPRRRRRGPPRSSASGTWRAVGRRDHEQVDRLPELVDPRRRRRA